MKGCESTMNIFKQFIKSFYSTKEVSAYRFQGIGKTIAYVFLLMFVSTLITGISLSLDFMKWASITEEKLLNEIPDFQLENGILTSELDSPIINENAEFTFIFDSTGKVTMADLSNYNNAFALLKKEAVFISNSDIQPLSYSAFGNLSLTKEDILKFVDSLDSIILTLLPVLFLIMYLFNTFLKFVGISFLALIGLFISKQVKRKVQYRHLWILSSYGVTIPTIFFSIVNALKIYIPFSFLLYWITAIIVLYLIIVEIPKSKLLE